MEILSDEQIEQLSRNFKEQMDALSDIDFLRSPLMNEDGNVSKLRKQVMTDENKENTVDELLRDLLWEADVRSTACVCMMGEKNISDELKAKSIEMQIPQLSKTEIQQVLNGEISHNELFFIRFERYALMYKRYTGENRKFSEGEGIENIVNEIYNDDKYGNKEEFVRRIHSIIKKVNGEQFNKVQNDETKEQVDINELIKNFKTEEGISFKDYRKKASREFEEIMSVENLKKFNSLINEVVTRLENNDCWRGLNHPKDSERPFEVKSIELALPENRTGRIFRAKNEDGTHRDVVTINPISFTKFFEKYGCKNDEDKLAFLETFVIHELTHGDQYNRNPNIIQTDYMPSLIPQDIADKSQENFSKTRILQLSDLEVLKRDFMSISKESLSEYFCTQSNNPDFTNSQLFFNLFSKNYKLHEDGQFDKMCEDMKNQLGENIYSQLMSNLYELRDKKVEEIKNSTGEFLTHTTSVSPEEMGGSLLPRNNLNQFGEKRDNFVFATESEAERDFYALRTVDKEGKNINWKKRAIVKGEEKNVFIMEAVNQESYTYFLPKEKFIPVVCLDGRFGHEWTANEEIRYSHYEKNNVEEIEKRNIVKVVDRKKFCSQSDDFYKELNAPNIIIDVLDNSGVLVEKNNLSEDRLAQLRGLASTKAPYKLQTADVKTIDVNALRLCKEKQK